MDNRVAKAIERMKIFEDLPIDEYKRYLTTALCDITESTLAYFASVNAAETTLKMIGWSRSAMMNCTMMEKPILYNLDETGLWGDAIRERAPVFTNDYQNLEKATKKGYPKGHVHVRRHLNLPITRGGKIVLVVGVGNKEKNYTDEDAKNMEAFIDGIWDVLKTKL